PKDATVPNPVDATPMLTVPHATTVPNDASVSDGESVHAEITVAEEDRAPRYPGGGFEASLHPVCIIIMSRYTIVVLLLISAVALLNHAAAVPISSRDRASIQAEVLGDLLEKVAEEMEVRAIERELAMEQNLETEELPQISSAPAKRDSNEKRNLSRLAQMGARGFGRRRR
ncbi:hypothetical protein PENTCL1PPCAC_3969, partial [Pristionchus entomophagus]